MSDGLYNPRDVVLRMSKNHEVIRLDGFHPKVMFSTDEVRVGVLVQNNNVHNFIINNQSARVTFTGEFCKGVYFKTKELVLNKFTVNADLSGDFYIDYVFLLEK